MIRLWPQSLILLAVVAAPGRGADSSLELADLAAYRAALHKPADPKREAKPVRFSDLWFHRKDYEGKEVRVEGRLVRRFHQESVGAFPALTEAWLMSPAGDPFCVVFPQSAEDARRDPKGALVRFTGTFLKVVRYQGGDGNRGAPLIVGGSAPVVVTPGQALPPRKGASAPIEWLIGIGAAVAVTSMLLRQYLARPRRTPLRARVDDPPLQFISPSETTEIEPRQNHQSGSTTEAERF